MSENKVLHFPLGTYKYTNIISFFCMFSLFVCLFGSIFIFPLVLKDIFSGLRVLDWCFIYLFISTLLGML